MDKQLLKSVMLDNQKEVQRYEVFKRDFILKISVIMYL